MNFKSTVFSFMAIGCVLMSTSMSAQAENFQQRHPRRAEVLNRDANLNRRANRNYGNLHGHYGQIKNEDRAIARQEQRDARMNGGHITRGEQHQLNREENNVSRQIERDKR